MTFSTIPELIDYINDNITTNGAREITGVEMHDILIGITTLISPVLAAELTVQLGVDGSVGGADTAQVFPTGTTLETVLRAILINAVSPTYTSPTAVLSSTVTNIDREIGTLISPQFSGVFTLGDAGSLSTISLKKNGSPLSATLPFTESSVSLAGFALAYQVTRAYTQGACKNNNLGILDCTGRITAGNVNSNTIIYNSYRKAFWGQPVAVPATSADVRALSSGSLINPIVGSTFTINIIAGAVNVVFAYPASLQNPTKVLYSELGADVKGNFASTTVSVEGANGFAAINYKVFTFTPVEPFSANATYVVTI